MKKNYSAWEIDFDGYPKTENFHEWARFLLSFAALAPSGHNSQPWKFKIESNNQVLFFENSQRSLSQSDPGKRQLYISMGCAIENFCVAADHYGFNVDVEHVFEGEYVSRATLHKKKGEASADSSHLIFSIPKRRTNRNKYTQQILGDAVRGELENLSNEGAKIFTVSEKSKILRLAEISLNAQIEVMDRDAFREELSHYVKSNFTNDFVGMPGFTLGMPAPISIFASKIIKRINMSRLSKKQDENVLKKHTPAFLLVATKSDEKKDWIIAGRVFERAWLLAERNGISFSPLAAGVQVGEYFKEIQSILGTAFRPQVLARLGYAQKNAEHSPRLSVDQIVV